MRRSMVRDGTRGQGAICPARGETVKGIKGAWVSEQKVVVDKDKVVEWRVTMKVSFVLE